MDSELDIQRIMVPSPGTALTGIIDLGCYFQMDFGLGYSWNTCRVKNGNTWYSFRQNSIEIPIGLKLYLFPERKDYYIKGGSVLFLLSGNGSFIDESTGKDMIAASPENPMQTGLQLGIGFQKKFKEHIWQTELRYLTFYSSPDYPRTDGSTADIRFHRIQFSFSFYP